MREVTTKFAENNKETNYENEIQNSPAINNRVEALKTLSQLLLREVEALKEYTGPENKVIENLQEREIDLEREVQRYEVELIRCALLRTGGKQRRAAKILNVKISTLNAKIKRYDISISGLKFALV